MEPRPDDARLVDRRMRRLVRQRVIAMAMAATLVAACSSTDADDAAPPIDTAQTSATEPPVETTGSTPDLPGVTDDEITIGITWLSYDSDWDDELGTDRGRSAPGADTEADFAQVVVDAINADGGIGGRQIRPIYYGFPLTSLFTATDRGQAEQAMCARFTEDNDVYAMLPYLAIEGVIVQCASATGRPLIGTGAALYTPDAAGLEDVLDVWYRPSWINPPRRDEALVDRLIATDFFGEDAKVGLLVEDRPAPRESAEMVLRPSLEAAGIDVVSEVAYPDALESPWDVYVQRFLTDGVTHVIFSACSGCAAFPFMLAAESQQFRPKYALTSDQQIARLPESQGGNAPHSQLVGARGIGWFPSGDLSLASPSDLPVMSPNDARCREIFEAAGLPIDSAPHFCEGLFFLETVLDSTDDLSQTGFRDAVHALGDDYEPVFAPATTFGPGRHDGVDAVFDVIYDEDCQCFRYDGDPWPLN